ncbi:MAG: hypothetical protein ACRDXF_03345, partial [Acidimicrobiia bacterium]
MAFRCDSCGHRSAKWMGFCPQCGTMEPLVEEAGSARSPVRAAK